MFPTSVTAIAIVVAAVLPGSVYIWAYERQASAWGVTLADRSLRFVAVSLLFHLVLGWPEFLLYHLAYEKVPSATGRFAMAWAAVFLGVAAPGAFGTVLGGLYSTRTSRDGWALLRRRLSPERESQLLRLLLGRTPAPRAWDFLFSDRPSVYLRIRTTDGSWLAGVFASASYAGGFPQATDLLLEEAWSIDARDGTLGPTGLGYPVYVAADQIAWLEVVRSEEMGDPS